MDRRSALERLDALRAGSDDLSEPEMAGLADALSLDDRLRLDFDRRRDWDRGITAAIRDVPVPEGLRDRLITRLSDQADRRPRPASRSRRRFLAAAAGLAASAVSGLVYWEVAAARDPVTMAEARDAAQQLLVQSEAPAFNSDFTPSLPDPRWQTRLRVHEPVYGAIDRDGHRAAAWHISSQSRARWRAVVVAVPLGDFASPPEANSISDRDYVPGGKVKGVRTVRWTQNGFVYVCCVDDLESLIAELENTRFA